MKASYTAETHISPNVEIFPVEFCLLIDFKPNLNGTDCSSIDPSDCISCPIRGAYFTGESINDYGSLALKYYYGMWILILAISLVGLVNNILVLIVLKRRKNSNSFDVLLTFLATFDALGSFFAIIVSTACTAYFGNWIGRGKYTMYRYLYSLFGTTFWRSGSKFATAVVTIERFLIITFPFKAESWFTPRNTKILAFAVFITTSLLSIPRLFGHSVEYNEHQDIKTLRGLEYLIKPNAFGKFWYRDLGTLHNLIDFWLPLPFIIIFNLLSLRKVRQLNQKRKELSVSIKREIRASHMFLPVVFVYLLTNIGPILIVVSVVFYKRVYREIYQVTFLMVALNSVANLPIYYLTSSAFKADLQNLVTNLWFYKGTNDFKLNDKKGKSANTSASYKEYK